MPEVNFWNTNVKKLIAVVVLLIFVSATFFYVVQYRGKEPGLLGLSATLSVFIFVALCLFTIVPGIYSFTIIRKLAVDDSERSVLPVFDSPPTLGLMFQDSSFMFTKLCLRGTIRGLPVEVYYDAPTRSTPANITFKFYPLKKEGSKVVRGQSITFRVNLLHRLKNDPKPKALEFAEQIIATGLTSGAALTISTKHYDQYE